MSDTSPNEEVTNAKSLEPSPQPKYHRLLRIVGAMLAVIVVVVALYGLTIFAASPETIRNPKPEHYHLRLQVIVAGKAEDFSSKQYQVGYAKDQCSVELSSEPFHFHDNKDQFVHVHWEGMTGGLLMKYYGWDFIGGLPGVLGYRWDDPLHPEKIEIYGKLLPAVPKDAKIYVYTGDEHVYRQKSFEDWKTQDLEKFLGKTSNFPGHKLNMQSGLLQKLLPVAYAHGVNSHDDASATAETDQQRLTRINNLLGNVVIFVQKEQPTKAQIQDRFNNLAPLTASTCSG